MINGELIFYGVCSFIFLCSIGYAWIRIGEKIDEKCKKEAT